MTDRLVLYGDSDYSSPYVFSSLVCLEEKHLPYELHLLDLGKKESFAAPYRDRSITGRVPSLEHGDFFLAESSAIDEYLEDVFPPPKYAAVYPSSPRERARARQIQAWLRSDLLPIREQRPTTVIFYHQKPAPLDAAGAAAVERLLRAVDQALPQGATSLFSSFCIADADLALMLHRLIVPGDPVPERIRAYAEAVWSRPSVRKFVDIKRPARPGH